MPTTAADSSQIHFVFDAEDALDEGAVAGLTELPAVMSGDHITWSGSNSRRSLRLSRAKPPRLRLDHDERHQHSQRVRAHIHQRMILRGAQDIDVLILDLVDGNGFLGCQAVLRRNFASVLQETVTQV